MNVKNWKNKFKFYEKWVKEHGSLTCFYCKKHTSCHHEDGHPNKTTIDHILPKSKGGNNRLNNLVVACFVCNSKKADKILGNNNVAI